MSNIALKVENVSKTFKIPLERRDSLREHFWNFFKPTRHRKFEALKNISFEVKKGEWFGLIGRNGSGKSTLLKILAGIYKPDQGNVFVHGKIVPFLELGVGFNPELSGRENIFLNGTMLGMTRKKLERIFDEIVDFAEIRDFLDLPLKNYSSGMQVRLAFSIAIRAEADIYLLDEVLAVGDVIFQQKCLEEFKKLKEKGKSVILVSHDGNFIKKHCGRALFLENHVIKNVGISENIIDQYYYENKIVQC